MAKTTLDPQVEILLDDMARAGAPPLCTLSPDDARNMKNPVFIALGGPPEPLFRVEDLGIPGPEGRLPVRVYIPEGKPPFPVLVFFHGGGWVIGNLETHDSLCRSLANRASCVVVSVDYRLAPEYKFPAAVEDAFAATVWVSEHGPEIDADPRRLAVGGDSAGGNLAAVVALMARDNGTPAVAFQLLIYPVTDLSTFEKESYDRHGESYILTRDSMIYYRDHYTAGAADFRNPHASPLLAPDLKGLPPALVVSAEYDVLTDEVEAYVDRLEKAGVPVTYRRYTGMIHPFFSFGGVLDRARETMDDVGAHLRSVFYPEAGLRRSRRDADPAQRPSRGNP